MAIFASTTTSGYSDPMKAMSIKALEARQKEMLAQMATQQAQAFTPENTQTPIQGVAQVANTAVDAMRQSRADQALVTQKNELAKLMSGYNPDTGLDPSKLGRAMTLSPELGTHIMTQMAAAREAQKAREATASEHALNRTATEASAARADERARTLQTERLTAEEKLANAKAKATAEANAADPKTVLARKALEKEATQEKALVDELGSAQQALEKGINTGRGSGLKTIVGQLPGGDFFTDRDQANRTVQFDATMDKVATGAMSTILKGSSTDKEMEAFKKQYNNPNLTIEQKREAFGRVLQAAKEDAAVGAAAVQKTGGSLAGPGGPAAAVAAKEPAAVATPQATSQDAQALEWATANPNDPRAAQIMKRLGK